MRGKGGEPGQASSHRPSGGNIHYSPTWSPSEDLRALLPHYLSLL